MHLWSMPVVVGVLRATVMNLGYNKELTENASGLFSPGGGAV